MDEFERNNILAWQPELTELDETFPKRDWDKEFEANYLELRQRLLTDMGRVYDDDPRSALFAVAMLTHNISTATEIFGGTVPEELLSRQRQNDFMEAGDELSHSLRDGKRFEKREVSFKTSTVKTVAANAQYYAKRSSQIRASERARDSLTNIAGPLVGCLDVLFSEEKGRSVVEMMGTQATQLHVKQNLDGAVAMLTVVPEESFDTEVT